MNCSGAVDAGDVAAFQLYLTNPTLYGLEHPGCNPLHGDMDGDGDTDWDDYDLFVDWLTGHSGAGGTRQVYAWDAENRLIAAGPADDMTLINGTKRASYVYDYMGRRIEKKVYTWQSMPGGQWLLTEHRRFVWAGTGGGTGGSSASGWLMLMELNGLQSNAVVRKYTWGLDLAGQSGGQTSGLSGLEGAAGIGGLLAVHTVSGSTNYVYFYDGNGNVGQVIDPLAASASASIKVKYEYDPYGTRTNLPQVLEFDQPFRFSTKYFDAESGLYYFGYRYYHPKLGRWMNWDPMGESASANLYAALRNHPMNSVDAHGLFECQHVGSATAWLANAGYEDDRYIYTCGCGWLDREHVPDWMKAFQIIRSALLKLPRNAPYPQFIQFRYQSWAWILPIHTTHQFYLDVPHTDEELDAFAEAIAFSMSVGVEYDQNFPWGQGFSCEDIPSNWIGIQLAKSGFKKLDNKAIGWIRSNCGPILTEDEAKAVCNCCNTKWGDKPDPYAPAAKPCMPCKDGCLPEKCKGVSLSPVFQRAPIPIGKGFTNPWRRVHRVPDEPDKPIIIINP